MTEKKGRRRTQILPTLSTTDPQLDGLRKTLGEYLVRVRPIPNGRDFLFSGPMETVENAARALVEKETSTGAGVQFDMARLDEVLLLRLTGGRGSGAKIRTYFKPKRGGASR